MPFDVIGVGHAAVDYLGVVPRYPDVDSKIELNQFSMQGGGPVATALVALAAFGARTSFIGKISDDDYGQFIRQGLQESGVDLSGLVTEPGCVSPLSFIAVEQSSGKRTIFYTRGNVAPLKASDLQTELFEGARILHVDGLQMEAQIAAATMARERGLKVVYDAGSPRPGMEELIAQTHVLIASERFAAEVGSGALAESLKSIVKMGPETVVITLGEDGCVGLEGGETYVLPALATEVVDTTGAGDVYHGAFIFGMLQGWKLRERMSFANVAAGLKCGTLGGRAGIPSLDEIDRALNTAL